MHGKTQEDRSCACSSSAALMQPWFTGFHLCPKHDLQDFTSVQSMICRISPPSEPLAHTSCNASLAWLCSRPRYLSVVQIRVLFIQTLIHERDCRSWWCAARWKKSKAGFTLWDAFQRLLAPSAVNVTGLLRIVIYKSSYIAWSFSYMVSPTSFKLSQTDQ